MRPIKRIKDILIKLGYLWVKNPDLRFGQLLENFIFTTEELKNGKIYNIEDDETEKRINKILKQISK